MRTYCFVFVIAAGLMAACGDEDGIAALTITTTSLPSGTEGIAYSATLEASDGIPPYLWSLASGELPAGLALDDMGTISGTPTTAGSSSFIVRVTDSGSPAQSATKALSMTVVVPGGLLITTSSLPDATTGTLYSEAVEVTGGIAPYTWSLADTASFGDLPPGLTLDPATGVISGTPTTQGFYPFQVVVTDESLPTQTAFASLGISVNFASILTITTSSLPDATTGTLYSEAVEVTGGIAPYTWSLADTASFGDLPPGLTLDPATGVISGTPTTQGFYPFQVVVTDESLPTQTAFASLGISVN